MKIGQPALHVWGYTAHIDGPIADALAALVKRYPDRFVIRFSDAPEPFAAVGPVASVLLRYFSRKSIRTRS
jgi:hypothetical protein